MQQRFRLLGISGSLRRASANTAVLQSIRESVTAADIHIFPLNDVPPYDEDHDGSASPVAVCALRTAIDAADGIILASPEYNYGMSGVLKNALDWASRPYGQSALTGKPVLTLTASPAFTGGVRAHQQMNETLAAIGARAVIRPQIVIGVVHEKLRGGRLADERVLQFALDGVQHLLRDIAAARAYQVAA